MGSIVHTNGLKGVSSLTQHALANTGNMTWGGSPWSVSGGWWWSQHADLPWAMLTGLWIWCTAGCFGRRISAMTFLMLIFPLWSDQCCQWSHLILYSWIFTALHRLMDTCWLICPNVGCVLKPGLSGMRSNCVTSVTVSVSDSLMGQTAPGIHGCFIREHCQRSHLLF